MSALDKTPVIATCIVAVAAGALAATASHDVAVTSGAVRSDGLAWGLPIILEGGAVTAGLLAWRRARADQGAWPERLVLLALMVLAVVVNAAHAAGGPWLGVVLAATPPLVLVASIELLLRNRNAVDHEDAEEAALHAAERRAAEEAERKARAAAAHAAAKCKTSGGPAPEPPVAVSPRRHDQSPAHLEPPEDLASQTVAPFAHVAPMHRPPLVAEWVATEGLKTKTNPTGLDGKEVGRRLGLSDSQGRRLLEPHRPSKAAQADLAATSDEGGEVSDPTLVA